MMKGWEYIQKGEQVGMSKILHFYFLTIMHVLLPTYIENCPEKLTIRG